VTVSHDPYVTEVEATPLDSPSAKDTAQQRAKDVAGSAKEQAADVAGTAKEQAGEVAGTAKEQAQAVTSEVRQQTQRLASDAQSQLMEHATAQRDSAAHNLRSIGQELSGMADHAEGSGLGVQIVRQGGDLTTKAAEFLEQREPGQLLDEVRGLARRRPGAFLLGAAFAGLLVGRAARGMKSAHSSDGHSPGYPTSEPAFEPVVPVPTSTTVVAEPPALTDTPAQAETPLSTDPTGTASDARGPASAGYPEREGMIGGFGAETTTSPRSTPGVAPERGDVP
jgi:hypothetical protein